MKHKEDHRRGERKSLAQYRGVILIRPRYIGNPGVEVFFLGKLKKRVKLIGRKIVVLYTPDKLEETIGKFLNIYFSDDI